MLLQAKRVLALDLIVFLASLAFLVDCHPSLPVDPKTSILLRQAQSEWSYNGANDTSTWGDLFPTCNGIHQSPVSIFEMSVVGAKLNPFTFIDYCTKPTLTRLSNNGHSASLTLEIASTPQILDGGLTESYSFSSLHFHWGDNNGVGSEHTFNTIRYPMEMHLVHYKTSYGSASEASKHEDGYAVLGVRIEVSGADNPAFTSLIEALSQIKDPGLSSVLATNTPLSDFLPANLSKFYRYQGSLTTPPCTEAVIWTLFADTVRISDNQMNAYRSLVFEDGTPMVNNYRPTQPLGDRQILVVE